ncbi:MAG TPA: hypothetical protein VF134_05275 [Candidatus Dormibacteraeota bacterium]
MRTLMTQMRLRRVLRVHDELLERLESAPRSPEAVAAAQAGSLRLLGLIGGVRAAWQDDLAGAPTDRVDLELLDAHVRRGLKALEGSAAALGRPGELDWLGRQFRATAVPLLLFLRGLEDASAGALGSLVGPAALPRSA